MRLGLAVMLMIVGSTGCAAGDALGADTDDYIDVNTPPSNCSGTAGGQPCLDPDSSGNPEGGPCVTSNHCMAGMWCTAPFDGDQAGDFTCTSQCIGVDDQTQWCLDSSACCDPAAECNSRGLCLIPEPGADTGSGTGSGTDTGTETDPTAGSSGTGETEGTSTGAGSSSGTGDATTTTGM